MPVDETVLMETGDPSTEWPHLRGERPLEEDPFFPGAKMKLLPGGVYLTIIGGGSKPDARVLAVRLERIVGAPLGRHRDRRVVFTHLPKGTQEYYVPEAVFRGRFSWIR